MDITRPSTEEFLKHLDIIQATIARLSTNSFALRGWSVTLIAGLFALAAKDANPNLAVIGYLPVFAFALLDGYYLAQERQLRQLFDHVAVRDESIPPFSLDTTLVDTAPHAWLRACFSRTLLVFHGSLFLTVTIVLIALGRHKS